jgi:hypothetical protein
MKYVCLLASLLAAAAGNLCAITTVMSCTLTVDGLSPQRPVPTSALYNNNPVSPYYNPNSVGCFTTSFMTTSVWDSLNWGASVNSSGKGQSGLGPPTPGNSFSITGSGQEVRSAHNDSIEVEEGSGYTGTSNTVTRAVDLVYEYSGALHGWQPPGFDGNPNYATFGGHFNSASTPTGTSDQILEAFGGPLELVFLNEPAYGIWFDISALGSLANTLFDVKITAYGSNSVLLGTYTVAETAGGTGGICTGLSDKPPQPCDNAPEVGFYDPEGRIRSIYISVFNPGNLNAPVPFGIDKLELAEIPEPAAPWMIGAGLAAIAFYGRKRRVRRIVSE